MSRLGRSYPSIRSGVHNARVINPAPSPFLPTLKTYTIAACQRASQSGMRRPQSTRLLSSMHLAFAPPNLSPLPVIKKVLYAVPRAAIVSKLRPMSTRIRPPNIFNSIPNLFLPTLGQFYHQAVHGQSLEAHRNRNNSTRLLSPMHLAFGPPNLFLPTRGVYLDKSKHTNHANSTRLYVAKYLTPPPFLPTVTTRLQAVNRSTQTSARRPLSTKLTQVSAVFFPQPLTIPPTVRTKLQAVQTSRIPRLPQSTKLLYPMHLAFGQPNLFLPTLGNRQYALQRSNESALRYPHSTRLLFPMHLAFGQPNVFLPTLTPILDKSRHTNRANSTILRNKFTSPVTTIFLPTLGYHLQATSRAVQSGSRRPLSTRLSQVPYLFFPPSFKALPKVVTKLQAVNQAREMYKFRGQSRLLFPMHLAFTPPFIAPPNIKNLVATRNALDVRKRWPVRSSSVTGGHIVNTPLNIFLPIISTKLTAIESMNRIRKVFRNSTRLSSPTVVNSTPPAFLPTVSVKLQSIPVARRVRYQAKLRPPTVLNPTPNLFLPSLGRVGAAIRQTLRFYQSSFRNATRLRKPEVTNVPQGTTPISIVINTLNPNRTVNDTTPTKDISGQATGRNVTEGTNQKDINSQSASGILGSDSTNRNLD